MMVVDVPPRSLGRVLALLALLVPTSTALHACNGGDGDDDGPMEILSVCGDQVVEGAEVCDDGNDDPRDDCTNECLTPTCGDGVAAAGEACDDADDDDADACTSSCELGPAAVVAVAAGEFHNCALSSQGLVRCWGAPDYGRLGQPGYSEHIGDDEPPSDWDPVEVADDVVALAAGSDHNCAVRAGGELRCWGANGSGQLGYGHLDSIGDDETPASAGDVPLPGAVVSVDGGTSHTCAAFDDGRVACWGSNNAGQLGIGDSSIRIGDNESVLDGMAFVSLPGRAVQVVTGNEHSCARLDSGDMVCWGSNASGQLGYGTTESIGDDEAVDSAGVVPLGGPAIDIAAGSQHTCAVLEGGTVRCWGEGDSGRLGYGDTTDIGDRKTPAEAGDIALEGEAVSVHIGRSFTCATMTSGHVYCWGNNNYLGLTTNDIVHAPTDPAQIGAPVRTMVVGQAHSCAILDTAGVRCWGDNTGWVLGDPEISSGTTVKNPAANDEVDVF